MLLHTIDLFAADCGVCVSAERIPGGKIAVVTPNLWRTGWYEDFLHNQRRGAGLGPAGQGNKQFIPLFHHITCRNRRDAWRRQAPGATSQTEVTKDEGSVDVAEGLRGVLKANPGCRFCREMSPPGPWPRLEEGGGGLRGGGAAWSDGPTKIGGGFGHNQA